MNKLRRKVETRYVPGEPATPPTPPVCTTTTKVIESGGNSGLKPRVLQGSSSASGDYLVPVYGVIPDNPLTPGPDYGVIGYAYARTPGGDTGASGDTLGGRDANKEYTTVTETTCTGGSPGSPGTPGRVERTNSGPDWRASARSIERASGDVVASFNLSATPRAALGFAVTDSGPSFVDLKMGALFRRDGSANAVIPVLNGQEQAVSGYYSAGDRVALVRAGGRFKIQVGASTIYDAPVTTDQDVFLDAMLYTSNDYVEDPAFGTASVSNAVRGVAGVKASLSGETSVTAFVGVEALVGTQVDGVVVSQAVGTVGFVGQATAVTSDRVSVTGQVGLRGVLTAVSTWAEAALTLPAVAGVAADSPYARIDSALPAIRASATIGAPTQEVTGADISLPTLGFYALSYTGGLLSVQRDLPSISGVASDRPYGQAKITLPSIRMHADDGFTYPGYVLHVENLNIESTIYPDPTLIASIEFGLELEPSLSFATLVSGSYFDGLLMDPSFSVNSFIQALIESGVNLSSATQAPKEGFGQYGFNLDTAAATRYEGFDFRGFAFTGSDTFAHRKDGVYRLREGDDDGSLRSALVDFGLTSMGTMGKKHIETVYMGVSTDGRVYLKLTADGGQEKTYRVIQRDPTYRVMTGRGITAREWNAKLEFVDSSSIELDGVEFVVAASGRKWVR